MCYCSCGHWEDRRSGEGAEESVDMDGKWCFVARST